MGEKLPVELSGRSASSRGVAELESGQDAGPRDRCIPRRRKLSNGFSVEVLSPFDAMFLSCDGIQDPGHYRQPFKGPDVTPTVTFLCFTGRARGRDTDR